LLTSFFSFFWWFQQVERYLTGEILKIAELSTLR
jgi:hypothetical protein